MAKRRRTHDVLSSRMVIAFCFAHTHVSCFVSAPLTTKEKAMHDYALKEVNGEDPLLATSVLHPAVRKVRLCVFALRLAVFLALCVAGCRMVRVKE